MSAKQWGREPWEARENRGGGAEHAWGPKHFGGRSG